MLPKYVLRFLSVLPLALGAPTATTLNGTYIGLNLPALDQDLFLGIPFANQQRFEQSTPLNETWSGTRDATEFGLVCAGYGTNPRENWPIGEDCLNLNVVRPAGAHEGLDLPVLIWIYGGGYRQGATRDPEFNTSFMVQTSVQIGKPVIVVSINYRLSALGFLASRQLQGYGALNIGLHDQRRGFAWVSENIRGFGGDPDCVTIWGESAGAQSVAYQVMAYGGDTQGLFRSGIMASGSFFGFAVGSTAENQLYYDNITSHTGCADAIDTVQCLKNLPYPVLNETVYNQDEGQVFIPVVDGDMIRTYPFIAFQAGALPAINLITGCNSDEGISLGGQTSANTSAQLIAYLEKALSIDSTIAQEILDLYPLNAQNPPYSVPEDYPWLEATNAIGVISGNQTRRAYAIFTDLEVMAGRRKTASEWAQFGGQAYSFRFDTDPSRFPLVDTPGLGPGFAQHGSELSWEFRLPYISPTPYPPLPNVTAMRRESYAMQAAWASFAATGSPNHHGLSWVPYWPTYSNGSQNLVFNATLSDTLNLHIERDDFRAEQIAWWNARWAKFNS